MNCQQIHAQLDNFIDGQLPEELQGEWQAHIDSCPECHARVFQAQEIQAALILTPVPDMKPGFAQKALHQATGKQHQRRGFAVGFSTALAAGLAMLVVTGGLLPTLNSTTTSLPDVAVSVEAVQTVNLAFDSANYIEKATLTIALPDHVELAGYPGLKQLTWQTSLKQGRNVLPLPIKALQHSSGQPIGPLQASIEINGKTKSFQAPIRVNKQDQPQASRIKPNLV